MEPISLSLTKDRLIAICSTMEVVDYLPTLDKRIKSDRAVFSEIRTLLFKKRVERERNHKDFNLKPKYYHAYHLLQYLQEWSFDQAFSHTRALVNIVTAELDQKLT